MKKRYISLLPVYMILLTVLILTAFGGSRAVTVLSENAPTTGRKCVIVDAGHGGVDGGATSYTGVLESNINLQIALRLNDLLHLLGIETKMIRNTDCSVYTTGDTIAAKKVSDLKERVRLVNTTENAIMVSIHQNHFADRRYSGAQVFYSNNADSKHLAEQIQTSFVRTLNYGSKRAVKRADGIYLMQHINCPGILIECGFLSNPEEESKLLSDDYQKKICCVIAATVSTYANT